MSKQSSLRRLQKPPKAALEEYITWHVKFSEQYEFFLELERETGERFPAIETKPNLLEMDFPYIKAFFTLSSDRQLGMAMGPIPYSSIVDYADRTGQDWQEFLEIIQHVDSVYMSLKATKDAKKPA